MVVLGQYFYVVIHHANVSKQIGKLTHVANTQLRPAWSLDKKTTSRAYFFSLISFLR